MHPFRKLLLVSLGLESSFEKDPSPEDWHRLYATARHQALLGVLNTGVHRLPERQRPPESILSEWDHLTGKIAEIYERHISREAELGDILKKMGLKGCILKGTGLARLYPEPCRRQCGDIDVWIQGSRKALLKAFSDRFEVSEILYQECKVDIFDDVLVELHFHPTKMYDPFCNARFQRWCNRNSPFADRNHGLSEDEALCYPSALFNAVFCMAHMYRHYLTGGLGIRQMMDYSYVLRELTEAERGTAIRTLKRLGMGRFTAATMLALRYNFGLEDEYLLCEPDMKRGPKLVNDLYHMGNFGILDPRNHAAEGETKLGRFRRRNRRLFSYLRYYPREIIWAPFSRLAQHFWRRLRGYL